MRRDPTFNEFFIDIYPPHARARKRSWTLDERLCRRHIMPYLGERHLAQISPADVESWLATLRAKGLAPSSCNRILAILKSVFAFAIITCHIAFGRSPCRNIRNFKIMNTVQTYLSKGEGRRLISHLRTIDRDEARIIELLLLTGARKSEILHARWENLDCDRRILTVPISKSGRPRYIYLSREAVEIFRNIVPAEGSP